MQLLHVHVHVTQETYGNTSGSADDNAATHKPPHQQVVTQNTQGSTSAIVCCIAAQRYLVSCSRVCVGGQTCINGGCMSLLNL